MRRFGVFAALVIVTLWAGGWLYWSGTFTRAGDGLAEKFHVISAEKGFFVRDVLVEGRHYADPAVILGLLDVDRGDPVFAFDPVRARALLEQEAWIKSARVERRLPGVIYVSITERTPFALWQNQGKVQLIDPQGVVITDVKAQMARFQSLPLVVGEGAGTKAAGLLDLMKVEPLIMDRLEAATYVGERRWDLKLKTGTAVRLPEDDLGLALRRLAEAQETDRLMDKDLESIDLRESGRIIVKTKPGAVQDYKVSFTPEKAI